MYRLRRLCSRDNDFNCYTGSERKVFKLWVWSRIGWRYLGQASTLSRDLSPRIGVPENSNVHKIRWVTLSGTPYEKLISDFTNRLNNTLNNHQIKIEVVKSTGSRLGQLLFNNKEKYEISRTCSSSNCSICSNNLRPDCDEVVNKSGHKYHIDGKLNCGNCGIYKIPCPCNAGYSGKTTNI